MAVTMPSFTTMGKLVESEQIPKLAFAADVPPAAVTAPPLIITPTLPWIPMLYSPAAPPVAVTVPLLTISVPSRPAAAIIHRLAAGGGEGAGAGYGEFVGAVTHTNGSTEFGRIRGGDGIVAHQLQRQANLAVDAAAAIRIAGSARR
jgi:hypothetical protein